MWQVLHDHAETVPDLSPESIHAIEAFLECGYFHAGFTRFRRPDCDHEFLLAFTCKQRGLCATCHQRRTFADAAFIADTVCVPVPHRHIVLTIPRLIRQTFKRDRSLLDALYRAAHAAITAWLRHRTGHDTGSPGLVAAVQTFGDFLLWHPHVHVIATAGVFADDGTFHLAPTGGWQELRELWRHALLRHLHDSGALADWQLAQLKEWRHSGFTLDAGEAPIAADDAAGRRRLAEYLLRAPFSLEKITYNPATGAILCRSERHWRTKRNFEVSATPRRGDPLPFGHAGSRRRFRPVRFRVGAAAGRAGCRRGANRDVRRARRATRRCRWRAGLLDRTRRRAVSGRHLHSSRRPGLGPALPR